MSSRVYYEPHPWESEKLSKMLDMTCFLREARTILNWEGKVGFMLHIEECQYDLCLEVGTTPIPVNSGVGNTPIIIPAYAPVNNKFDILGGRLTLTCLVSEPGRPAATEFIWRYQR